MYRNREIIKAIKTSANNTMNGGNVTIKAELQFRGLTMYDFFTCRKRSESGHTLFTLRNECSEVLYVEARNCFLDLNDDSERKLLRRVQEVKNCLEQKELIAPDIIKSNLNDICDFLLKILK